LQLVLDEPVGRGNTSLVLRCRLADGRAGILKLTPNAEIAALEASALRAWAGSGRVPQVWGWDEALAALLLEAIPGERSVLDVGLPVDLGEVASLLEGLHRSGGAGAGFPSLADGIEFIFEHWIERHGGRGPVPVERLRRGCDLARELDFDTRAPMLLHGDLHPANVLDGGRTRGLVAVDPRPCVGDPAVDAVDWVFWAAEGPDAWNRRSRELALALGLDPERLWAWCRAFAAMLAASRAAHGAAASEIAALLALAP
jgi:streptomycin 6-kinase